MRRFAERQSATLLATRGRRPERAQAPRAEAWPGREAAGPCSCGGGCPACANTAPLAAAETAARNEPHGPAGLPDAVRDTLASPGRPLDGATRGLFEARHGQDMGDIRVHTDAPAAASAAAVGARAYASGRHIAFARGAYEPGGAAGLPLLAHEIAHVTETAHGAPGLRKQDEATPAPIAANDMIGLPVGTQVVVTRSMGQMMFMMLSSRAPDVAAALTAVSDQRATIATADADTVAIRFNAPTTIPAVGTTPAMTISGLVMSVVRNADGTFDFTISGTVGSAARTLYSETGLSARAANGGFILAQGSEDHLQLTPAGSATGQAQIEAFTAPYLAGQPGWVRSRAPATVGLINIQGLPAAPRGSDAADAAARRAIETAAAQRRVPHSTLMLSGGIMGGIAGPGVDPLVSATYRYAFTPTDLGNLVQVPLQFDVMYAPTTSVIGAVSSGIGTSLEAIQVPINVRLTAGIGGGAIETELPPGSSEERGPLAPVLGPTFGLGVGYQPGWFRIEVRGDLLINALPGPAPTVLPMASLGVGGAF